MRISDWSSDVCSSDLGRAVRALGFKAAPGRHRERRKAAPLQINRATGAAGLGRCHGAAHCADGRNLTDEAHGRADGHTSELQSLMRSSYAVFCSTNKQDVRTMRLTKLTRQHTKKTGDSRR